MTDELEVLRAERDALQARIDAYEGHLEEWEEVDRLIAASSLGTPEAVAMREQTPKLVRKAMLRAAEYLTRMKAAEHDLERVSASCDRAIIAMTNERERYRAFVDAVRVAADAGSLVGVLAALHQLDVGPTGEDT